MAYVIILSVIAGVLGIYYYFFMNINIFKKHKIPHITPLPLLGNVGPLLFRRETVVDFIKKIYNIHPYAKYVGMYQLAQPLIVIRDPDLIKSITLKHFDMFSDHRSIINESEDPLLGKHLAVLRGERWREVRSILSPAFTSSKLKSMFKLMLDCGANFANYLVEVSPDKSVMDTKDIFTRYTTDVIATCAFGVNVDSMKNPKNNFYMYGKELTTVNFRKVCKMYIIYCIFKFVPRLARILKLTFIRGEIASFFRELVQNTIKSREENHIIRPDMLQLMIDSRNKKDGKTDLTIEDMTSQAFVFFLGGFETSSTFMCFVAYEIGINRSIQEKLQNEIDKVLEDSCGELSYEAINSMEYLDAVINESLRMYPVSGVLERLCVKDFELPPTLPGIKSFTIKKDQSIIIPVYGLHHDPKYFKEPEKFNPERFLDQQRKESFNCGVYLPFGIGPRMCIGNRFALLETKVLIFHLLARCDLKPCDKTSIPLKWSKKGLMLPENGFWLDIVPRTNPHQFITTITDTNDSCNKI